MSAKLLAAIRAREEARKPKRPVVPKKASRKKPVEPEIREAEFGGDELAGEP